MFPIINFFGREIGSYALFAFLGFIVCGIAITVLCKGIDLKFEDTVILILVTAAGLLIGGHLLYGTVSLLSNKGLIVQIFTSPFKKSLVLIINCFGGMIFYGGFIGGFISLKIYQKICKLSFKDYIIDIYAFSIPLFHFFGRIGCFFAGCCYGIESKFGFTVTNNNLIPSINNLNRFPVALLEAILNLGLFILIAYLFKIECMKFKLVYVYMLLYPLIRFFTEFLRGDTARGIYLGLSTSQWISIVLFTIALFKLSVHKRIPKGS